MKIAASNVAKCREASEPGHLFVFEGPDDVGKSVLVSELTPRLRAAGQDVVALSFPGQEPGTIGRHIYELHHAPENHGISGMSPTSLQLLHIAAHIDLIERTILPGLRGGKTVLLDRYWWSTWVYGRKARVAAVHLYSMLNLEHQVWGGRKPTALFLLRRNDSYMDSNILDAYRVLAEQEGATYPIVEVSNNSSITAMVNDVAAAILRYQRESLPVKLVSPEKL